MKQHKSTLCYAALAKKRILNKVSMYIPSNMWLRFNELSTAIFHLKIKGGGGMKLTLANRKTREKTKHKSASMGEENSTWLEKNNTSQSSTFQVTPHSQEKGSESADLATEGEHESFSAWQQVRTKRVTDMEITSASTAEKEEANRCHLPLKGPVRQSAIFCSEGHFFFFFPNLFSIGSQHFQMPGAPYVWESWVEKTSNSEQKSAWRHFWSQTLQASQNKRYRSAGLLHATITVTGYLVVAWIVGFNKKGNLQTTLSDQAQVITTVIN